MTQKLALHHVGGQPKRSVEDDFHRAQNRGWADQGCLLWCVPALAGSDGFTSGVLYPFPYAQPAERAGILAMPWCDTMIRA